MFLVLAFLLLIFVPWPWSLAAAIASLVLFVFEVAYWQRRMRHRKVQTGVENLVGATGEVTSPLAPVGQIRVKGELWEARASTTIDPGTQVRVVAVHGLTLEVTPVADSSRGVASSVGALAVATVTVFLLVGCGGSDESASESYANDVCSSFNTWASSIEETTATLKDQGLSFTGDDVRNAIDDAGAATDLLVTNLKDAGPPETEDGDKAQSELQTLTNQLEHQLDVVKDAAGSGQSALALVSTVSSAVSTAASDVQSTFNELDNLDPAGELSEAFKSSDDCKSLQDKVESLKSGS
jgi:membrane protein implicated in regulation of membrane protease activity